MRVKIKRTAVEVKASLEDGEISEVKVREVLIPIQEKGRKVRRSRIIVSNAGRKGDSRIYGYELSRGEERIILSHANNGVIASDEGRKVVSLLVDKTRERTKRKKRQGDVPSQRPRKRGKDRGLDWETVPSAPLKRKSLAEKKSGKMMEGVE